ncbi:hypothetical protein CHISP_2692 [Chitinispirillum alkaliphilum]|nr:hypothetical protein CHISP_2692 [Chitinispirillum alkaliphilum]
MLNFFTPIKSLVLLLIVGCVSILSAAHHSISDLEALEAELAGEGVSQFSGNYRILVTRPVFAPYSEETRTQWISAVSEAFFRYKISTMPKTYIYTQNQISTVLRNYRDFSRRISKQAYIDAAKELGATHLLYQEYEPQGRDQIRFATELIQISNNSVVAGSSKSFEISELEAGLFEILDPVAMYIYRGARNKAAYTSQFLGGNQRLLQNLGNELIKEGNFDQQRAKDVFAPVNRLASQNPSVLVTRYSAAKLAARSGNYRQATEHQSALLSRAGEHPALLLNMAYYYRLAQDYSQALSTLGNVENVEGLRIPAAMEKANILEAMGNYSQAKTQYEMVLQSGKATSEIYYRLALVSVQLGQPAESRNYLNQAQQEGHNLTFHQHFRLARAYSEQGSYDQAALDHLNQSLGIRQNNPDAWKLKAQIHLRNGRDSAAAQCYVNLFHIDNSQYRSKLRTAGEIFERNGYTEDARDAYSLFLARRFNDPVVSLRLATIYFNENDCNNATNLLEGIDTLNIIRDEATKIMDHCLGPNRGGRAHNPHATMSSSRTSPFRIILGISSGVLAAGGAAGGFLADREIQNLNEEINDISRTNHQERAFELHNQINNTRTLRNALYITAAASLSLFTINIAIPSGR